MKHINKTTKILLCIFIFSFVLSGCGKSVELDNALSNVAQGAKYGIGHQSSALGQSHTVDTFACDLVVGSDSDVLSVDVEADLSVSALVFCLEDDRILYQNNIYTKLNPASTTKILTAYTALKYGDLNQTVTVSENATNLIWGSSKAGFNVGDTIRLEDCLYGLMLPSGNDAATAIAESISGSVSDYADLMNAEARKLGATSTHYVNAHGLTANNHYTTVYDLYLMLNAALKDETFYRIITCPEYTCEYHDAEGNPVTGTWKTTNYYLLDKAESPDGVQVMGGKTGTTEEAGSCLVMFSKYNDKTYVSIVLGAPSKDILYKQMTQLLYLIVK